MNLNLSVEQELFIRSLLQQDPCHVNSLASVIWDSLSYTGINDVHNSFGIYFTKQAKPEVVLWESDTSIKLPRQAFLEVLELATEYTLKGTPIDKDVTRLTRALKHLKLEIAHLKNFGDSLQYYCATESLMEDAEESINAIKGTRFTWLEGLQDTPTDITTGLSPITIAEGKTPYQVGKDGAFSTYSNRIRSKLKVLNVFRTILAVDDEIIEDEIIEDCAVEGQTIEDDGVEEHTAEEETMEDVEDHTEEET